MVELEGFSQAVAVVGVAVHGQETDQLVRVLLDLDGIGCCALWFHHDEWILLHLRPRFVDGGQGGAIEIR